MPTRFHPDLTRAEGQPRALVTVARLPAMRAALSAVGGLVGLLTPRARSASGQSIWLYPPQQPGPRPAVLWIHGGGLIFGSPLTERAFCQRLRDELGVLVASPAYRFAPRHPFPAALDDVYAALEWLAAQPDVDPTRIMIGGDSAGGGLAAALAVAARGRGGPEICFQLLHEPMLDDRAHDAPGVDADGLRVWSPDINRFAWEGYLRGVPEPVPPEAAPARLVDAAGLPPAWIGIGTADLFHPGALAYADKLRAAGVPVDLHEVEGGYHGFVAVEPSAAVSRDYADRMVAAFRAAMG